MDVTDKKIQAALRVYQHFLKSASNYYHAHKEEIAERRKERYRNAHPNPKPRGRPRKEKTQEEKPNEKKVRVSKERVQSPCPDTIKQAIESAFEITGDNNDRIPFQEIYDYLVSYGISMSNTKVSKELSKLGLITNERSFKGKNVTFKLGVRRRAELKKEESEVKVV